MKNKRGSHVGVILSFVIFITFIIFLFSILGSPLKISTDKDPLIDYIEIEFMNKYVSNLTILTISPTSSIEDCIEIKYDSLSLDYLKDLKSIVKDETGAIINSKISGDNLIIKRESGKNFFKIYYAEETLDNSNYDSGVPGSCSKILDASEINSVRENKYFTTAKINKFFLRYEDNYDALKTEFRLPSNAEFGLSFIDTEGNMEETEQRDILTDIFSREIPIQYFGKLANIKSGFINIRVW